MTENSDRKTLENRANESNTEGVNLYGLLAVCLL